MWRGTEKEIQGEGSENKVQEVGVGEGLGVGSRARWGRQFVHEISFQLYAVYAQLQFKELG